MLPDQVYIDQTRAGDRVTLVYVSRPGIPVSASTPGSARSSSRSADGSTNRCSPRSSYPGREIEEVTVNGGRGYWLEGTPHQFFYRDSAGNPSPETLRLAGNTLLWEQGGVTFRLEAQVSRDDALRIATTFR